MPEYDIVIKDGMVFDGARNPRVRADVAVVDGKVADIGRIPASAGRKVLDASGLNVAPGFVDLHTHYDAQVFWDPYCTLSGWHGVTSVAIGNCGFGFAPVRPEGREQAMRSMTRVEAIPYDSMRLGLPWDWETFPEFLDALDRRRYAADIAAHIGHVPLRTYVMGEKALENGPATEGEIAEMARLVGEAIDAGAVGFSTSRVLGHTTGTGDPVPGTFAT
jgi:N-acyl-D-amino-acid deacylase